MTLALAVVPPMSRQMRSPYARGLAEPTPCDDARRPGPDSTIWAGWRAARAADISAAVRLHDVERGSMPAIRRSRVESS